MTADGEIHEIFCGDCQPANGGSPHRPLICEQRRSEERVREYHETDEKDYNRHSVLKQSPI
jgi:hypothetical protein